MNASPDRRFFLAGAATLTLAGCGSLLGPSEEMQVYVLRPATPNAPGPSVSWRLAVLRPAAGLNLDSNRISISRSPTTMDYYANAAWGDRLGDLVQKLVVQAFEASNRIASVAADTVGAKNDYQLALDIRNFEARYDTPDGAPTAVVRIHAKLITQLRQAILGDFETAHEAPASANTIDAAVLAFDAAFGAALGEIVGWTLRTGQAVPA